jgi:hypothetical protein
MDADVKKVASKKLVDAFLAGVRAEPLYEDRAERAMPIAMAVMMFIVDEKIEPATFLNWLDRIAETTIIEATSREEADLFDEARSAQWH